MLKLEDLVGVETGVEGEGEEEAGKELRVVIRERHIRKKRNYRICKQYVFYS